MKADSFGAGLGPFSRRARAHATTSGLHWGVVLLACWFLANCIIPGSEGRLDPDFWWHMSYAKKIFAEWAVPVSEWLSWSLAGHEYRVSQWLGEAVIGAFYFAWGDVGARSITAAVVTAAVAFSWRTAERDLPGGLLAFFLAVLSTQVIWSTMARPQMFGYLLCAILVWLIEKDRDLAKWSTRLSVFAVVALWVNAHGSWIVGLAYPALQLVTRAVEASMAPASRAQLRSMAGQAGFICAILPLASLFGPHGYHAWEAVLFHSTVQYGALISEWQPSSMGTQTGAHLIMLMIGVAVVMSAGNRRPGIRDVCSFVLLSFFGLMAVRQVPFVVFALVPLLARAVHETKLPQLLAALRSRVNWATGCSLLAVTATLAMLRAPIDAAAMGRAVDARFPVRAVQYLEQRGLAGRLWNEQSAGGWIAFHTGRQIYIDGRVDLFGDKFCFDWFFTRQAAPGWAARVAAIDPEIFVIQSQSPLRQALLAAGGHALVFDDAVYSIVVKRLPRFADVIKADETPPRPFVIWDDKGKLTASMLGV